MKTLAEIQQQLKAPKGQRNTFGKYNYRSCEDILNAVKQHLDGWSLMLSDEIVLIGDRYYIKATATLKSAGNKLIEGKTYESTAYAREPLTKKGMDEAQITGATSSYARKYALNGLFAIDGEKDADSTNKHESGASPQAQNGAKQSVKVETLTNRIQNQLKRLTDDFKDTDSLTEIYMTLEVENFNQIKDQNKSSQEIILNRLESMK